MFDTPVTICFVIPQNRNKIFKQIFSEKMFQAGNIERAIVRICSRHVTRFGPIACRYFALWYNNEWLYCIYRRVEVGWDWRLARKAEWNNREEWNWLDPTETMSARSGERSHEVLGLSHRQSYPRWYLQQQPQDNTIFIIIIIIIDCILKFNCLCLVLHCFVWIKISLSSLVSSSTIGWAKK